MPERRGTLGRLLTELALLDQVGGEPKVTMTNYKDALVELTDEGLVIAA